MIAHIGIDIGGTKIRGVLLGGNKVLAKQEEIYFKKPPKKSHFLQALFSVLDYLVLFGKNKRLKISGIGIGTAGIISGEKIYASKTLKVLDRINISEIIREKYKLEVIIENDVKTSLLGEWNFGAAKGARSAFMITLGTGLGGAYIVNGNIQHGAFDSAYEAGFLIIDANRVFAGKRGDFEWYSSENFFKSRRLDPIEAEIEAKRGNKKILILWKEFGRYLGVGVASIINILEPEIFVIGGGIANAWPFFAPTMKKTAKTLIVSNLAKKKIKIVRAKLGRDSGAIGAALLFRYKSYPHPIS